MARRLEDNVEENEKILGIQIENQQKFGN